MNYKTLLAALAVCVMIGGCGKGDEAATDGGTPAVSKDDSPTPDVNAGGIAGTYTATAPGGAGSMTVVLAADNTFTMTSTAGAGKGSYVKDGDKVTLTILETDGKPASEEDKKNALVLTLSADGNTLDGPGDMDFKKQ